MHAKNSVLNERTDRHVVEALAKLLPKDHRVATAALIEEAIVTIYCLALMVSAQQVKGVRELGLHRKQQRDDLNGLLAAVYVVADEQVLTILTRIADVLERAQQVCVLTVNVANYV